MFNSTAPIKFFSNLEETVKEITTLNGANIKLRSSKERQTGQNLQKEYGSIEERKIVKGGTQQISVPKIQQSTQQRTTSSTMQSKRKTENSSKH